MCAMKSKMKGKAGEREVRNLFRVALLPVMDIDNIRRNHQQAEIGGHDLVGVPYYSVEIKRYAKLPGPKGMRDWWNQTCAQAQSKEPCLVFREDRGGWFVMMLMQPCGNTVWMAAVVTWEDFAVYLLDRVTNDKTVVRRR